MDVKSIDVQVVTDLFLLLLIGVGPKIALVPYLELTDGLDSATKARVIRKMLTTVAVVALVLIVLGEVLRKLLHCSDLTSRMCPTGQPRRAIRCGSRCSRWPSPIC